MFTSVDIGDDVTNVVGIVVGVVGVLCVVGVGDIVV